MWRTAGEVASEEEAREQQRPTEEELGEEEVVAMWEEGLPGDLFQGLVTWPEK